MKSSLRTDWTQVSRNRERVGRSPGTNGKDLQREFGIAPIFGGQDDPEAWIAGWKEFAPAVTDLAIAMSGARRSGRIVR
jgi:hypothetical protein